MTSQPLRILIAFDGSANSRTVFDDLRRAGLPGEAMVQVLSVGERWLPFASSPEDFPAHDTVQEVAGEGAAVVRENFPSWSVTAVAMQGSPALCILDSARQWNADLIALGASGQTGLDRVLLGSVSAKVADEAPCSVRIARPGTNSSEGVRLVAGFDGQPAAGKAIREIARRSWPRPAAVRLITCVGFGRSAVSQLAVQEDYARARALQAAPESELRRAGLAVSAMVREDDPKIAIVDEARSLHADAVFVGCNGDPLLTRLLLGSVSAAVLAHAPCSVEIVRERPSL